MYVSVYVCCINMYVNTPEICIYVCIYICVCIHCSYILYNLSAYSFSTGIKCYECSSTTSWADCVNRQYELTCPYQHDRCMQFSNENTNNSTHTFFKKCAIQTQCSATFHKCQGRNIIQCDFFCCMGDLCNAGSQNRCSGLWAMCWILIGWLKR